MIRSSVLRAERETGRQPPGGLPLAPPADARVTRVARAGDRGITRERILALLWPDADEEAGRRALSQALHALRNDLHEDLPRRSGAPAQPGRRRVRLLDFESALAAREWERAAAAWTGPFLQGFRLGGAAEFDRWMEEERTHLAHRYAELLEQLARTARPRSR